MTLRLEAFREILPTLPARRRAVFDAIASQDEHGATLAELVRLLGWAINRISGRVTELSDRGLLRECGVRGGQTVWAACLPQGPIVRPRRPQTVKARIVQLKDPDLFGRTQIIVSIPSDVPLGHLKPEAMVAIKL